MPRTAVDLDALGRIGTALAGSHVADVLRRLTSSRSHRPTAASTTGRTG